MTDIPTVVGRLFTTILRRSFVITVLLWLPLTSASAQKSSTDGSTPLGLSPGAPAGSYALSGFDNINLYNGNLNFRLPLLHIGGRGTAGYTMTLAIQQRWRVVRFANYDSDGTPDGTYMEYPDANWWAGLEPGYGPAVLQGRQVGDGYMPCNAGPAKYMYTLTRLTFTTPDGTEYDLGDQANGGKPLENACGSPNQWRGTVFTTSDGTAATFVSDTPIFDFNLVSDWQIFPSGYLMLHDGTRYRVDGGRVSWLQDPNGNRQSFTYDEYSRVKSITDSMNRITTVSYAFSPPNPASQPYDEISFKGFLGTPRTIRVWFTTLGQALRADYSPLPQQLFPELNGGGGPDYDEMKVSSVELPDGRRYQFKYNPYGELARVELPTGGALEYDPAPGSGVVQTTGGGSFGGQSHIYRRVMKRRVYRDGVAPEGETIFSDSYNDPTESYQSSSTYVVVDHLSQPGGALIKREKHYFYGDPRGSLFQRPLDYAAWKDGREYQTEEFDVSSSIAGSILRRSIDTWQQRAPVGWWPAFWWQDPSPDKAPPNDPRIVEKVMTLMDTNQVSKNTSINPQTGAVGFDQFNNPTDTWAYDYGPGAPGSLLRHTHTDYLTTNPVNGVDYTNRSSVFSPHMLGLPSRQSVFDPAEVERAGTTYEYDNCVADGNHAGLVDRPGISGMDSAFTTGHLTRGNVTGTTRYFLANGSITGSISAYAQYDIAGNVVKAIDARGYATTLDYTDRFGAPDAEARSNTAPAELSSVGQSSYTFATSATNALSQTAYSQFDFCTGRPVDVEDANGIVSSGYFNDALDRPTQIIRAANNLAAKSQTSFSYDDVNHVITTTSDQNTFNDNALKGQTVYDGLGRAVESRQYEGGTNYIAVQTQYDALSRAFKTSNPFRPWQSESAVWTITSFDALGRVISVTTPDNAAVSTAYSGNTVTVTDQAGKKRQSVTDGLGRLKEVYEDPTPGLNYLTSYSYDVLDNLTSVSQGVQTRTFVYDSLKRLTSATNPESGTIGYLYDNNGNPTQKTDARSITTNYVYDALNRVTSRSYQNDPNSTPAVNYTYDSISISNGKGRLAAVSSSVSTYSYSGYDALGHVAGGTQTLGAQSYTMGYTYDKAGHVLTQTYPSGRTVSYSYDSAGRTNSFTGNLGDGSTTPRTYSSGIIYSPLGGMTKEQFGTDTPVYNKLQYNIRGQLWDVRVSTGADENGTRNRGALQFFYDQAYSFGGSNPDNNGNATAAKHYRPLDENSSTFTISTDLYSYDPLNRLLSVSEFYQTNTQGATQQFVQSYLYDRYGNRTINQATWGTGINNQQFTVNAANNRVTAPGGFTMNYDGAGNLIWDDYTGQGQRTYDAENRMKSAWGGTNQDQVYTYNADGQRVKRNVNGVETWQVYGIDGELLAEYAQNASPLSPQKEYGYRNGQLLITAEAAVGSGGSPFVFTDDPLVVGVTMVKATHLSELRTAVNQARAHAGLSAAAWTDDPAQANVTAIKAVHLTELRARLDQARIALGLSPASYTDPTLTAGITTVKAVHIQELRTKCNEALTAGAGAGLDLRWLVSDQLGTPRIILDKTGSLANVKRHDYLPFGEELFAGTGGRTTAQGYVGDSVRQKYTSKERDNETGLDYFLARFYSSTQGRFTSVDPQNIVFDKNRGRNADERARILQSYIVQPQNWNRYAYTRNNPLAYTDPDGRCSAPSGLSKGNSGICIEAFIASPRINTIGRGDNRSFAANDPSKTSRLEVSGTFSRSASGDWNTHLTATPGKSYALVGPGLWGSATLSVTQNVDKEGNLHVQVKTTGDNGFSGLPGAPAGQIQINVNLIVTPDGKVGIESGERTAYPTTGLYVYTMGADGKPAAATLGEGRETTPAALTQPLVPIQPVPPTCNCPKPEDEKTRRRND